MPLEAPVTTATGFMRGFAATIRSAIACIPIRFGCTGAAGEAGRDGLDPADPGQLAGVVADAGAVPSTSVAPFAAAWSASIWLSSSSLSRSHGRRRWPPAASASSRGRCRGGSRGS